MLSILDGLTMAQGECFRAESMALNLGERDSSASITLGPDGPILQPGAWVQDLTDPGAGIVWRVKTVDRQIDKRTVTVALEHAIQSLADRIIPDKVEPAAMGGSGGVCTALQAVTWVLNQQDDWILGEFDYEDVTQAYSFSGETLKAALEKVDGTLEDSLWTYDFSAYPWVLSITRASASVSSELRAGRNLSTFKYTLDKSRMYTRFYPVGKNNARLPQGYEEKNADLYGVIEKTETDQSRSGAADLSAWAYERLDRHAQPTVTGTVSGLDLSEATGEPLDRLTVGGRCRVPLPELGEVIEERITKLAWRDKIKEPQAVTVTLANQQDDVQTIIRQQNASGGKSARTAAELAEEQGRIIGDVESGLYTRMSQTASELRQEAHNEVESLRSFVVQTASGWDARVEQITDSEGHITAASIALAINDSGSQVIIEADHIDINGLVTMLETMALGVGSLHVEGAAEFLQLIYAEAGIVTEETVKANIDVWAGDYVYAEDGFRVGTPTSYGGHTATWQSKQVITSLTISMPSINLTSSRQFMYAPGGDTENPDVVNGKIVTSYTAGEVTGPTTETIYYLGRTGSNA